MVYGIPSIQHFRNLVPKHHEGMVFGDQSPLNSGYLDHLGMLYWVAVKDLHLKLS